MLTLTLHNLLGHPYAITIEDGWSIATIIQPYIVRDYPLVIDMTGIETLASPFAITAFGPLTEQHTIAELEDILTFIHFKEHHVKLIWLCMKNCRKNYEDPERAVAVSIVMSELLEDE